MNKQIFQRIHGTRTPFWVWALMVGVIALLGAIASLTHQSIAHVLTAGVIILIIAKHVGLGVLLLGPARLLWRRLSPKRHDAAFTTTESILGDDLEQSDPAEEIRAMGYRLRNEFRKRLASRATFEPNDKTNDASTSAVHEEIPDMQLVDTVVGRLSQWNADGRANVPNPRGAAGLLISAAYGVAAMEFLSKKPIMDGAIDGLTATIWTGIRPKDRD
jgi:AcrR family transcriptional regulator